MYSSTNDPKVTITTPPGAKIEASLTSPPNHYTSCSPKVAQMVTLFFKQN